MPTSHPHLRSVLLSLSLLAAGAPAAPAKSPKLPDHWVGTWAAAPVARPNEIGLGTSGATLREIVHVSLGGPLVRVVLSNEFGTEPLHIGAAHIADAAGGSSISLFSSNALTFGGRPEVTIPPGALVVSDPAGLTLKPLSDVAVSLFVPQQTISTLSEHSFANQISYMAPGNVVGSASLSGARPIQTWPILKGIETRLPGTSEAIVCFGDSITDGAKSTESANVRWPDDLARRLQANGKTRSLSILNEGIGANRVLNEGFGPAALARFDRDVLAQAGVRYLIVLEGINDIGNSYNPHPPTDGKPRPRISAEDLIVAYQQMITRAHTHGIRVFGATLTPFVGAGYQSAEGEQVRQAVNQWIRTTKDLDGVLDFDKAVQNPTSPNTFAPAADSGDHLHPGDAGYRTMADSIDLKLFIPSKKEEPVKSKVLPPPPPAAAATGH